MIVLNGIRIDEARYLTLRRLAERRRVTVQAVVENLLSDVPEAPPIPKPSPPRLRTDGLPDRRLEPDVARSRLELHAQGLTDVELAEAFGISVSGVGMWRRSRPEPLPRNPPRAQ